MATNWNGMPMYLQVSQPVTMPQTPAGTLVFGYFNAASQNNEGQLVLTSGGSDPIFLNAPFGIKQPQIYMQNWQANNLNVSNTSANANTSIFISAYGPGIPGQNPLTLNTGTALPLTSTQSAQGTASPQWMQLRMSCNSAALCIFAVVGGPLVNGTNGYVFAVNYSSDVPPAGYTQVTTSNTLTFPFNWGASSIYVVNMSPLSTTAGQVLLTAL